MGISSHVIYNVYILTICLHVYNAVCCKAERKTIFPRHICIILTFHDKYGFTYFYSSRLHMRQWLCRLTHEVNNIKTTICVRVRVCRVWCCFTLCVCSESLHYDSHPTIYTIPCVILLNKCLMLNQIYVLRNTEVNIFQWLLDDRTIFFFC